MMSSLHILAELNELQISKLTWVWWYVNTIQTTREENIIIFKIVEEECGKQAALKLFQLLKEAGYRTSSSSI
jgi:hypothetical protein